MYFKYYLLSQVDTLSFVQTTQLLQSFYPNETPEKIFKKAFRLKRGLKHTEVSGVHGTTYQKDKVYLDGYYRLKTWTEEGGDISLMLFGKVKISDLPLIAKI